MTPSSDRRRRIAVILSGGGARGAYEVGVLSYEGAAVWVNTPKTTTSTPSS